MMNPLPDVAIGPSEIVSKGHKQLAGVGDHQFPKGWKASNTQASDIPTAVFSIDWPDYSIPTGLGREFWLALVEDIYTKGVKTISCQCMGGHGRTGVQLAILMHYLTPKDKRTWKDAADLVMEVRKRMCEHCVESKSQQKYIAEVCDLPEGESVIVSRGFDSAWDNFQVSDDEIAKALEKPKPKRKPRKGKKGQQTLSEFAPKKHFGEIQKGWKAMLCLKDDQTVWMPEGHDPYPEGDWTRVDGDINDFRDQFCAVMGEKFHPLEMHDMQTSKLAMAQFAELEINDDRRVKVKGRWYHPAFLEFDEEDMAVMLASDLWKRDVKAYRKGTASETLTIKGNRKKESEE